VSCAIRGIAHRILRLTPGILGLPFNLLGSAFGLRFGVPSPLTYLPFYAASHIVCLTFDTIAIHKTSMLLIGTLP
jgi:hypothetical protein